LHKAFHYWTVNLEGNEEQVPVSSHGKEKRARVFQIQRNLAILKYTPKNFFSEGRYSHHGCKHLFTSERGNWGRGEKLTSTQTHRKSSVGRTFT
jgi:hypothetical protein